MVTTQIFRNLSTNYIAGNSTAATPHLICVLEVHTEYLTSYEILGLYDHSFNTFRFDLNGFQLLQNISNVLKRKTGLKTKL